MTHDEKKRVCALRPRGSFSWCYVDDLASVGDYMADADIGDVFEVKFVAMTQAEIDAMPEFNGW